MLSIANQNEREKIDFVASTYAEKHNPIRFLCASPQAFRARNFETRNHKRARIVTSRSSTNGKSSIRQIGSKSARIRVPWLRESVIAPQMFPEAPREAEHRKCSICIENPRKAGNHEIGIESPASCF